MTRTLHRRDVLSKAEGEAETAQSCVLVPRFRGLVFRGKWTLTDTPRGRQMAFEVLTRTGNGRLICRFRLKIPPRMC
ncbi:hypothetical protein BKA56DRAFT_604740 [Ilyonectria sp. MPI-CAGE-AT-0026]|nr:hypothetical protein BKA56DRAFT_604740 [Ilyonectria sp. MPI-CAGE-AT-0026]